MLVAARRILIHEETEDASVIADCPAPAASPPNGTLRRDWAEMEAARHTRRISHVLELLGHRRLQRLGIVIERYRCGQVVRQTRAWAGLERGDEDAAARDEPGASLGPPRRARLQQLKLLGWL
jgi:hypothetical protein